MSIPSDYEPTTSDARSMGSRWLAGVARRILDPITRDPSFTRRSSLRALVRRIPRFLSANRTDAIVFLILMACFFAIYHGIGQQYATMPGYDRYNNLFFGADQTDALKGWVDNHKGVHPLLLIIVVPVSHLLVWLCGSHAQAMIAFGAGVGSLAVATFFVLGRMAFARTLPACWLAILYGISMSQLVFSGFADTYVLAALGLMPSYMLTVVCLKRSRLYFHGWILAGLASFSITITNVMCTAFCLGIVVLWTQPRRQWLPVLVRFVLAVAACGTVLSLVQRGLIPDAKLFFAGNVYTHEMQYAAPLVLESPRLVCAEIVKTFFMFNLVGQSPVPSLYEPGVRLKLVYFQAALQYHWLGLAAVAIWWLLLAHGVYHNCRDGRTRPWALAVLLGIGANMALHAVYGTDEMFLYSPHFTFAVVLVSMNPARVKHRSLIALWFLLPWLVSLNNVSVVRQMVNEYGQSSVVEVISEDYVWKLFRGKSNPGGDWALPDYDDSHWEQCRGGVGYGDHDDHTVLEDMRGHYSTVFVRTTFELPEPVAGEPSWLMVDYDDGFVAYLNGKRIAESNAPSLVTHTSTATQTHEAGRLRRFRFPLGEAHQGRNVLAIVALNVDVDSSDLTLNVRLVRFPYD